MTFQGVFIYLSEPYWKKCSACYNVLCSTPDSSAASFDHSLNSLDWPKSAAFEPYVKSLKHTLSLARAKAYTTKLLVELSSG